jgi:hypothetical protein
VNERKRILGIGAGVGPEYRDLKREGFGKLLEWVGASVNAVEEGHLSSS